MVFTVTGLQSVSFAVFFAVGFNEFSIGGDIFIGAFDIKFGDIFAAGKAE